MVDDRLPPGPAPHDGATGDGAPGAEQGWRAISYLITGILVWGGVGWMVDLRLDTGGLATVVGSVVGAAAGVYLTARRLGV